MISLSQGCPRHLFIRARPSSESGHCVAGTSLLMTTFGWVMKYPAFPREHQPPNASLDYGLKIKTM